MAGQRLVARASEVSRSRRIAVYRIDVVRPERDGGETAVSSFTGTVSIKDADGRTRDTPEGVVP